MIFRARYRDPCPWDVARLAVAESVNVYTFTMHCTAMNTLCFFFALKRSSTQALLNSLALFRSFSSKKDESIRR